MSEQHGDRARGFAAFPARRGGRARGLSYWGSAWAESLEEDWSAEEELKKGRTVARSGRLGPLAVGPGHIAARVYGGAAEPYRVLLTLPELDDAQWDALWERTADRPTTVEEMLGGELPADLLEAAEDARLGLLPGYGELEGDCDCEELGSPCAHAVALGYQFSWLLDEEPQLLLWVRGREWSAALEELKSVLLVRAMTDEEDAGAEVGGAREAASGAEQDGPTDGIPVTEVYARAVAPLPPLPPLTEPAERETVTGIEADPMERLVVDAADGARELLAYCRGLTEEPPRPLDAWQDTVRIAATHPDPRVPRRLRDSCERPDALDRAARAWRFGGAVGLEVLEEAWEPPPREVAHVRTVLSAGWEGDEPPELVVQANRWTLAGRGQQLRYGRDGRWYPYREESGDWWPSGEPAHDPALVLAELLDA